MPKVDFNFNNTRSSSLDFLSPEADYHQPHKLDPPPNFMVRKAPKTPNQIKELV